MIRTVGLVSCTKTKREEQAPPRDLYDLSALFKKASTYCETAYDEWYVLSAKHGLLDPDGPPIEPYEKSLTDATATERREWAAEVASDLKASGLLTIDTELIFHAGGAYTEPLIPEVEETVAEV